MEGGLKPVSFVLMMQFSTPDELDSLNVPDFCFSQPYLRVNLPRLVSLRERGASRGGRIMHEKRTETRNRSFSELRLDHFPEHAHSLQRPITEHLDQV